MCRCLSPFRVLVFCSLYHSYVSWNNEQDAQEYTVALTVFQLWYKQPDYRHHKAPSSIRSPLNCKSYFHVHTCPRWKSTYASPHWSTNHSGLFPSFRSVKLWSDLKRFDPFEFVLFRFAATSSPSFPFPSLPLPPTLPVPSILFLSFPLPLSDRCCRWRETNKDNSARKKGITAGIKNLCCLLPHKSY